MSEENGGDKFKGYTSLMLVVLVAAATVFIPAGCWIATKYFGWQPPGFIQSFLDIFQG